MRLYQNGIIWRPDNPVAPGAGRDQQTYVLSIKVASPNAVMAAPIAIPGRLKNRFIRPNETHRRSAAFPR